MEGLRTGPYMCVRVWVKTSHTRPYRRARASMTEGSKPRAPAGCVLSVTARAGESSPGWTYVHNEPRRNAAASRIQQPGCEGQSRRQLSETRRNIFTFSVRDKRTRRGHKRVQNKTRKEFTHCFQEPDTLLLLFLLSASSLRAPQSIRPSLRWTFPAAYSLIDSNVAG